MSFSSFYLMLLKNDYTLEKKVIRKEKREQEQEKEGE
jgi:hypothetical protein